MAKTNFLNIDEYHATFSGEHLSRLNAIRNLVKQIFPNTLETISYQIPAVKIGKIFLMHYCGFKNHISISSPWSENFLDRFKNEIKNLKVSKAVIQFPIKESFPLELIKEMVMFRLEEVREKQNLTVVKKI